MVAPWPLRPWRPSRRLVVRTALAHRWQVSHVHRALPAMDDALLAVVRDRMVWVPLPTMAAQALLPAVCADDGHPDAVLAGSPSSGGKNGARSSSTEGTAWTSFARSEGLEPPTF
jgi:hypothetical protein